MATTSLPDWGLGNIFDPFGVLRTAASGGDPLSTDPYWQNRSPGNPHGDPASSAENYGDVRSTAEEQNAATQILHELNQRGYLSNGEVDYYLGQIEASGRDNGPLISTVMEGMQSRAANAEAQAVARQQKQQLDTDIKDYRGDLSSLRSKYLPGMEADISRFQGIVNDPNRIRSDAEYGSMLTAAEGSIDAQVNRERMNAGHALSSSGVRSSGKLSDSVLGAERWGTTARSNVLGGPGGLLGDVRGRLENAQNRARGFETSLNDAWYAAGQGNFNNNLNYSQFLTGLPSAGYSTPTLTGLDIGGLRLGEQRANRGELFNYLMSGTSLGMNAGSSAMEGIQGFLPAGR